MDDVPVVRLVDLIDDAVDIEVWCHAPRLPSSRRRVDDVAHTKVRRRPACARSRQSFSVLSMRISAHPHAARVVVRRTRPDCRAWAVPWTCIQNVTAY